MERDGLFLELESRLSILERNIESLTPNKGDKKKEYSSLLIIKKNKLDNPFPYCIICCKEKDLLISLSEFENSYPEHEVIYQKSRNPVSIKLYKRIRKELGLKMSRKKEFYTPLTQDELIRNIDELYNIILNGQSRCSNLGYSFVTFLFCM